MVYKGAGKEKEVGACLDDGRKGRTSTALPCIARVLVGRVRALATAFELTGTAEPVPGHQCCLSSTVTYNF